MGSLFPCLPDEIGLECLVRVELNSHHNLRCVCKSWNAALKSPYFYQERKRLKISEQRICVLQKIDGNWDIVVYDLEKNSCKSLPPIPGQIYGYCHCHVVKQKLVLIGNMFWAGGGKCIWLYDFACSEWRKGAGMPKWQEEFASAADEERGLIYVGGGFECKHCLTSASVYDVEEDRWDLLPDMNTFMEDFTGVFADGKFYVMDNHCCHTIEVFDSYTRSWKTMENRFNGLSVCLFELLYCFSGMGLIEYDYRQDKLHIVETFPTEKWHLTILFTVVVGHNILICRWDHIQGETFCMLTPPSERGGAFKWIDIDRPLGFQGYAIHAATLDL